MSEIATNPAHRQRLWGSPFWTFRPKKLTKRFSCAPDFSRFSTFIKSSIPWATVKKVGVENRIAKTLRFPRLNKCFLALWVEKWSRNRCVAPARFTPFLRFENVDIRWDYLNIIASENRFSETWLFVAQMHAFSVKSQKRTKK